MNEEALINLIWTAMWLVFIAILCCIFKSWNVLWLLIIWAIGIMSD